MSVFEYFIFIFRRRHFWKIKALHARAMNIKDFDYVFKVVIIGENRVGKTTLLKKYIGDISLDFGVSTGHLRQPYIQKAVKKSSARVCLELHDTMGNFYYPNSFNKL